MAETMPEPTVFVAPPPGLEAFQGVAAPPGLDMPLAVSNASLSTEFPAGSLLLLPPGLEPVEDTPGLQLIQFRHRVKISGLPNGLLNDATLEALFEQGGLEESVLDFEATPGEPCGEVLVAFPSQLAALQCVRHFSGCQWDRSGIVVSATLVEVADSDMSEHTDPPVIDDPLHCSAFDMELLMHSSLMDSAAWQMFPGDHGVHSFSVDAPCFVPLGSHSFSSEAPCFVPSGVTTDKLTDADGAQIKMSPHSDTSTEMGESEPEDDTYGEGESPTIQPFMIDVV